MVIDLIRQQNELIAHECRFVLWPRQWANYENRHALDWRIRRLAEAERPDIPNEPGVYTLLIQPDIAAHPACSYLMYVGKAERLRRRFRDYLVREKREKGRPKIFRGLNLYSSYLWFCFTLAPVEILGDVEDTLLNAYVPPWNDQLPAEIRGTVGAFR